MVHLSSGIIPILKPSSNRSLFKLIISDKIEAIVLPIMCILMGKRLAVFFNSFLLLQSFFGLKMHKSTFLKKKNGFESSFYIIDNKMVTNWSV